MSSLNDRQQNRPVTYSHYTKNKRESSDAKSAQSRVSSGESKANDRAKRKSVQHSTFASYFANHVWALVSTLGSLYRTPLSTMMTTTVIGIALALPAGLFVLLQNVQHLSSSWDNGTQISLFLKHDVKSAQTSELLSQLESYSLISDIRYISAAQAFEEFREKSGFNDALTLLEENPLPSVLVISLANQYPSEAEVNVLMEYLSNLESVDTAQLDMQWLARLNGMIQIAQRGLFIVALLLGLAILVIVGNTIRLTIQNRCQEIEVSKLIGATDSFIQRPFLYGGIWYGLIGGVIAWGLIFVSLHMLKEPVKNLSVLYSSDFTLIGLGVYESITIILIGIFLGWLGSWVSVRRHLREIEPK
ncbi:MAG: cell division protein FtsX [Gammaproteobacteria bacterium]|nr:cell division protein FtsX [Gammaproteobacteria bacterium]